MENYKVSKGSFFRIRGHLKVVLLKVFHIQFNKMKTEQAKDIQAEASTLFPDPICYFQCRLPSISSLSIWVGYFFFFEVDVYNKYFCNNPPCGLRYSLLGWTICAKINKLSYCANIALLILTFYGAVDYLVFLEAEFWCIFLSSKRNTRSPHKQPLMGPMN